MPTSNAEESSKTPIRILSEAGIAKLRTMAENSTVYAEFLKFQGRVFKHTVNVALEFFTQKPETQFIATQQQWNNAGCTISQGSDAIRFVDKNGNHVDYYDFSQVEETTPPSIWTINAHNVQIVKNGLGIPNNSSLINGVINRTMNAAHITECMKSLNIAPNEYSTFKKSFVNAVQLIIAGRLEIGGSKFAITPDVSAMNMLQTDAQKLFFLTHAAKAARESLMKVEITIQNHTAKERNNSNDLREMDETNRERTGKYAGRGTSGNTAGTAEEQLNSSENDSQGERSGMGNHAESEGRSEHEMVSDVSEEGAVRTGNLVQVRPDNRTVQHESDGGRTDTGGPADWSLRHEMDGLHGGSLPSSGNRDEIAAQISDGSSIGRQISDTVQGLTGRTVREDEPSSGAFRGNSPVGTGANVLHGQYSDEGDRLSTSDRSLEAKLNSVFSATETVDANNSEEHTTNNAQLVDIYINSSQDENTDDFAFKIHAAFAEVLEKRHCTGKELKYMERLETFAAKEQITENLVDAAFEQSAAFRNTYGNRKLLSINVFGRRLGSMEKELNAALARQFSPVSDEMEKERAIEADKTPVSAEQESSERNNIRSEKTESAEKHTEKQHYPKKSTTSAEKLYQQFADMFPDIVSGTHSHEQYEKTDSGYETLSVEHLGGNTYSFMTYYIQNGDVMRDPDFTFKLDHESKTLTIIEYQQDGVPAIGTVYQCVHDELGNADKKLLAALEKNFMQNLKNAQSAERPLTEFTNKDGERTSLKNEVRDVPEVVEEIIHDSTPELREVLNEFSTKHGLGELNVEPQKYNWVLKETMQDGAEHILGEITNPEYGIPFTPENLRTALDKFEITANNRGQNVSDLYGRRGIVAMHGLSPLPKVQDDLPEIVYAKNPMGKINDNITAIREMLRLEEAERTGEDPYDKKSNQYNSKQASEQRLRKYCGWGGLPQVFDERLPQYDYYRKQLQDMLTPEEYAAARESTLNAHYTPQIIIDSMYNAIKNMDLPRDSRILEPACGTGNFISRLPHSIGNAEVVGVELDSITARIANLLNRENGNVRIIHSGFEHTQLENGSFHLAIGNVPFGDYNMVDPDYVQDWRIHDAFFRKALDKVAAGGVVAFVTSSGTMDKANPKIREYLATQAELVGAIRLPNTAFSDAGTKVTSDIIFLKKRETPLQPHEVKPDWCYTVPNADGLKINSYFVNNPQMVLGTMEKTTHFDMLTCTPFEGANLETQLNEAIKNLNAKITVSRREKAIQEQRGLVEPWGKNFTFQIKDGEVYYRMGDRMETIKCSETEKNQIQQLCEIRTTTRELIDMQKTTASDEMLLPIRNRLNKLYDDYTAEFGLMTSKSVKKRFGNDADYPLLQSLEQFNKEYGEFQKSDIFFRRTVNPTAEITSVESVEEALQVSLDRKGKPDIPYMAVLLDEKYPDLRTSAVAEKVYTQLLEKGYIFVDPEKNLPDAPYSGVVERSEYLSGNVRMKLTLANEYAKTNPEYQRNAEALAAVIPEDIRAEEIAVQMGCPWIDSQDYTAFLEHLSGRKTYDSRKCDVSYSTVTGEFEVMNAGSKKDLNLAETTTYGTADFNMYQLAEKILNQRRIVVQREKPHPKDPSKTVTRMDPKATKIALEKAKVIREEFKKWIFADPERKAKYERKYNDIFNSLVGRTYDGSRMTFSGIANNFLLRPHQKNCIARAIYGGNTLAAHVVGAGKSAVLFTSVMKKKELGLIHKACVVVPKPLTEQTANEWRKIYPDAKILTVTNDDLSSEAKRNLFTARVATGSYDAVILSQEQFEKIPMSRQYRIQFMQKELDALNDMLREKKIENSGRKDYSTKAIERAKKQLQAKLERLLNPKSAVKAKDDLLEFEQLGFDYLVCDEAHAYKNGFVNTKMTNVAGVTTRPSGRAEDMQMKTDYFNEQFGQGHILFATGTPVSNSMTELYVMTRYLRPDLLQQAGVERFDDWAATFGSVVTKNQQAADGTLKMRTSFAKFANLPELMAMYKEFADVQSADKLNLPRPMLKTGKPQIISVPATPEQRAYVQDLAVRARMIADGHVEPHEDNLLKITGEARLIGLGNHAIKVLYERRNEELPYDFVDGKDSKVDKCVQNVAEIYQRTEDTKGVQIIFSDIAVNSDKGNFSVYDYIKKELIEAGIPEEEIIFAPKSDSKERENIFRDINAAKYRVVIASTGTLGTGANIQQNLYALHHVDVPWKPSDFEQREGRILRQGNRYDEVEIFNYVTEGTLDSYLYQTVTDKARFIAQLLDDQCPARVSEDCDEKVLTFGEIQAAAEGNPDFKRRIELANEIAELTMLRNEYAHETAITQSRIERIPAEIKVQNDILSRIQQDKTAAGAIVDLVMKTDNGATSDRKSINAYLLKMAEKKLENPNTDVPSIQISGFEVSVQRNENSSEVRFVVKGEYSYSCVAGVTENQDNYQRISNLFEKIIPKKEDDTMRTIVHLETNLKQAEERVATPFSHGEELELKMQELQELEERLAGISEYEDEVIDPEETEIIETAEEVSERKAIYNVDDNDYQPIPNDNENHPVTTQLKT